MAKVSQARHLAKQIISSPVSRRQSGGAVIFGFLLVVLLCSWGYKGHQTIGYIAQRHLTPKAAMAVKQLLGGQTLAEVSTWADEVDRQPEWRYTAHWHYINEPAGLSRQQFNSAVRSLNTGNLLYALNKCMAELRNPNIPTDQRAIDLKFIVHLIGDAHQPMHVSRAEDKGGNKIQVRFNGRGTNLHALWDSKLLDKQGLNNAGFAARYDVQTPAQIASWQNSPPIDWMYESYLLSTRLYAETATNRDLTVAYYNQHIALADKRLEIAGIRLAGVLNRIFSNAVAYSGNPAATQNVSTQAALAKGSINANNLADHYNQVVTVNTKVFGVKNLRGLTLADAGGRYPNQIFTIVLKGRAQALSGQITGKMVTVTGTAISYHNKPEIVVTDPSKLIIR